MATLARKLTNCRPVVLLLALGLLSFAIRSTAANGIEQPGPSSRRTGLAITEIMYRPAPTPSGKNLEFIELFNSQAISEDLSGYQISGDVNFTFSKRTVLAANAYLVVAKEPNDIRVVYGITNVVGPFTNSFRKKESGGRVRLLNELGAVLLDIHFRTTNPWPIGADGTGHSLSLARPSYGESDPQAWGISERKGGSPGRADMATSDPIDGVQINEVLSRADSPDEPFIELFNHTDQSRNLEGAWFSNSAATNRFRISGSVNISANGHVSFRARDLGFNLNSADGRIFLVNSNNTRVIDAVEYPPGEKGISYGRFPDGAAQFYRLAKSTSGAANSRFMRSTIVINEIMYDPISGRDDDQFVELYNRAESDFDLSGWRLTRGVEFRFPARCIVPAHGYVVIAKNAVHLRTDYANLNSTNCVGNFKGTLSHGGESLALSKPELVVGSSGTRQATNIIDVIVDEVTDHDGGRWGRWAHGGGSSLELIDPNSNGRLADNWADSDESQKAPWTTVEYTGQMGETLGTNINKNLHLYLLGVGECLVDDIEVFTTPGKNRIVNGGFESGLDGWSVRGAYDQSTVEPGGVAGGHVLHVRASSRGDTGMNKICSSVFEPISATDTVTIRCKARWLRGWPELLLRLQGGGAEAFGKLALPKNPGTPGARNSRAVSNAGPAIFEVQHTPALPAAGKPVVITAQVDDPDGIANVSLRYRIDPDSKFAELKMNSNPDGIFSASLPPQPTGTLVAFHIVAVDRSGATNTFPKNIFPSGNAARMFPSDATSRECLVRFGNPQVLGAFANYHIWTTRANRERWAARDRLSNADLDATFVHNNDRIIYNAGALFAGSSWHTSQMSTGPDGTNRCDYVIHLPEDDRLLGETDLNLVLPGWGDGSNGSDLSGMSEQIGTIVFRKMRVLALHRRYVHLFINGSQRSAVSGLRGNFVYEDLQQPNGSVIKEWFPNESRGQLFKLEDWFEFDDDRTPVFQNREADLIRRLAPGSTNFNVAPIRYTWRLRNVHAGESANDYRSLFALIDVVSPTSDRTAAIDLDKVNRLADIDEWFREIACQRMLSNSDSYGWNRGKNCYFYHPAKGRFTLIPWDYDSILGLAGEDPNGSIFGASDPRITAMMNHRTIRQMYLRAFQEMLDGPLRPGFLESAYDERAAAFTANGVSFDPRAITIQKKYLAQRRVGLSNQLAQARGQLQK